MAKHTITITGPFADEDRTMTISLELDGHELVGISGVDSEGRRFEGSFSFIEEPNGLEAVRSRCCCKVDHDTGAMLCRPGPCRHPDDDDDNDDQ